MLCDPVGPMGSEMGMVLPKGAGLSGGSWVKIFRIPLVLNV